MEILNQLPVVDSKVGWPWTEETKSHIYAKRDYWPKISIITPSFNQGQFIEETIRSILLQNYPNLEYIIIDGGSSDNTIEIIKKYEKWVTFWISESDNGQSDAINKGLKICTGEIFNWINSDDYLSINSLANIASGMDNFDLAACALNVFSESHSKISYCKNLTWENLLLGRKKFTYNQPACWLKLSNLKKLHPINDQYHFCFDIDLMIRYLMQLNKVNYINFCVANFRLHETSKTIAQSSKFHEEYLKICEFFYEKISGSKEKRILAKRIDFFKTRDAWQDLIKKLIEGKEPRKGLYKELILQLFNNPYGKINRVLFGAIRRNLIRH